MSYAPTDREAETAILLRMAKSRAALLKANCPPPTMPVAHGQTRSAVASMVALLADAPHVTLLLALGVGTIVLGPRRTIGIAGRAGIAAWLGGTMRNVIRKSV
jgi:hypothetical protein